MRSCSGWRQKDEREEIKPYKLYATNGCGSMIVEVAFGMAKVPFEIVDVPWEDTGWKSKALKKLNPLGQVPSLVLPTGDVMTETAAIVMHVADTVSGFDWVPPAGHPARASLFALANIPRVRRLSDIHLRRRAGAVGWRGPRARRGQAAARKHARAPEGVVAVRREACGRSLVSRGHILRARRLHRGQ